MFIFEIDSDSFLGRFIKIIIGWIFIILAAWGISIFYIDTFM